MRKKPSTPVRRGPASKSASFAVEAERYELCLFIAGTTRNTACALETIVAVCEERLADRYELVVVDVYQEPAKAKADQIIAVPTLLRRHPPPERRLVGDLSDRAQVLAGLDLPFKASRRAPVPHEET